MAVDEKQIAFWGKPETKAEEAKVPESRKGVAKVGASEGQVKIVDPNKDEVEESDDESGDEDEFGSSDEMDADSDSGWETESESDEDDEDDEETPPKKNQGKKGPNDSASKTPVPAMKAKIYTPEAAEVRRRFLEGALFIRLPGSAGKYCKRARLDPKKDEEEESDDESDVKSGEEDEFGSSAKMDGDSDSDMETESESDEDDEETPPKKVNQGKESPNDSSSKTPVPAMKAKIYTPEAAEVRRRFLEGKLWIRQTGSEEKHRKHAITGLAQAPLGDVHVKCERSYSDADAHDTNCAKTALACYNQQNRGAEYELVEPIKSHPIFNKEGIWCHVNFMAKPKSNAASGSSDASQKLFFAELNIVEDFKGLFSSRNRPLLSRCCIVEPNSTEDILGCGHCHPSCRRG